MKVVGQQWRKSTYSAQATNCVELNDTNDMIRDSKNHAVLPLDRDAVAGLLRAVRTGTL
ncbi:MAG: DUF397 domain-containing protein [Sciscionella sp.]